MFGGGGAGSSSSAGGNPNSSSGSASKALPEQVNVDSKYVGLKQLNVSSRRAVNPNVEYVAGVVSDGGLRLVRLDPGVLMMRPEYGHVDKLRDLIKVAGESKKKADQMDLLVGQTEIKSGGDQQATGGRDSCYGGRLEFLRVVGSELMKLFKVVPAILKNGERLENWEKPSFYWVAVVTSADGCC